MSRGEHMLKNISKVTLRLMTATLFLILFNTLGYHYDLTLPMTFINIIILAGFGIPGLIVLVMFEHF